MAKVKHVYICSQCNYRSPQWLGKCPGCGGWDTFSEAVLETRTRSTAKKPRGLRPLTSTRNEDNKRIGTSFAELDRVLGGGLTRSSTILLGGEPGIGKSTLALQTAANLFDDGSAIYVAGEESPEQLNGTASRLGLKTDTLQLLPERSLEVIIATLADKRPDLAVIDSVQVIYQESSMAPPASLSQLKTVTMALCETAKAAGTSIMLIGHVTKSGDIAGPKALEHIVDTVLYLEGERFHRLRLLRAVKNRFGSTNEVGVFEMTETGMREVERPSELFLAERSVNEPGSAVVTVVEGTRPILAEIQALTSPTNFAYPQRVVNGVDQKRLAIVLAVMEKRLGYELSKQDVFVNAVGGLKLLEPGADLALALAVASSMLNRPVAADTATFGEVGLAGEVRGVGDTQKRVNEAAKMGFKRIIGPKKSFEGVKGSGAVLTGVENVVQAINAGLD